MNARVRQGAGTWAGTWAAVAALAVTGCSSNATVSGAGQGADGNQAKATAVEKKPGPESAAEAPIWQADFEESDALTGWRHGGQGYTVDIATDQASTGRASLRIHGTKTGRNFGAASSSVAATGRDLAEFKGRHLRLSGAIKTVDMQNGYAGLWMRIDGLRNSVQFDNMGNRGVVGSKEWARYDIVLPVPDETRNIVFGALVTGSGTAYFDDLRLEFAPPPPPPVEVELTGVVKDRSGAPVAGALVAVVPGAASEAKAVTRTGTDGTFRAPVPTGRHAFTATAAGHPAAYRPPEDIDEARAEQPFELALDTDSERLTGTVTGPDGKGVGNVRVRILRASDFEGDIFYTDTDARGRYDVQVSKGKRYFAHVDGDTYMNRDTTILSTDKPTEIRVVDRAAIRAPASDEVIAWLRDTAVPLRSAEAGNGFADMMPIKKMVGKARLVSLGEATHGTREIFQLKHRMLEFLVENMGFTVFTIEANYSESLAVNDYVLTGKGDPRAALAGMYFWTWNTEEVLALIEWMRAYNADPKHRRKLEFYGYDMQITKGPAELLLAYLQAVDGKYAGTVEASLASLASRTLRREYPGFDQARRDQLSTQVADLGKRMDAHKKRYVGKSSERAWVLARRHVVIMEQALTMFANQDRSTAIRDRAMADNLLWIMNTMQPRGTRVVSWAHNGHASRKGYSGVKSMGHHVHNTLGQDQVIMGFVFNKGSFQAMDWSQGVNKPGGLVEHKVGPAPPGFYGAEFARTGHGIFVLDIRSAKAGSPAARWLHTPHMMRATGAIFRTEEGWGNLLNLSEEFDALIFIDETTRARPNPEGERPAT